MESKIKYLAKNPLTYGANESANECDRSQPRYIRITDITEGGLLKDDTYKSLQIDLAKPYLLSDKDILFARSGGTVGKTFLYRREQDGNACFAGYLIRFTADISKVYPEFVYYYTQSSEYNEWIKVNTIQSTIQNVSADKYGNLHIPIHSLTQQQSIIFYLDRKTAQIDTIIADKEKLIELLTEKRQSFINEAVTKGLDHTVHMKDSGVEWIRQIPAHWEVKRIKFVFEIVKRLYYQEDRDVLSITQKGIKIRDTESNDGQLAQSYAGYQLVHINDFAMNSMDLLTGFVDCSLYEGVTSPDYRVFRFISGNEQSYSYYKHLFQMLYINKIFYGFGQGVSTLGRWRLQAETFKNFWIPVPPLVEQKQIAEYVIEQSGKIDAMIDITQKQISLLKEYRQSVISEAVTGKVRV